MIIVGCGRRKIGNCSSPHITRRIEAARAKFEAVAPELRARVWNLIPVQCLGFRDSDVGSKPFVVGLQECRGEWVESLLFCGLGLCRLYGSWQSVNSGVLQLRNYGSGYHMRSKKPRARGATTGKICGAGGVLQAPGKQTSRNGVVHLF